ncbi:MAG: manganese efflux pump [Alistipes sp.]|nr:manganese efflux pump [Alistipes sp.]
MGFLEILLLGVGLSLDTFAVSLTLGCVSGCQVTVSQKWRFLIVIGIFHFLMILFGWFLGENVSRLISSVDHWIAFGLLAVVGGKMIQEGCSTKGEQPSGCSLLSLRNTMMLGVALSIDALISGFSLGLVRVSLFEGSVVGNILLAALLIGLCAFVISAIALRIGAKVSSRLGSKAEIFGGIILIGIGAKVLIEHLCSLSSTL